MPKAVLIVDDDPNILDTAKDILEDAGFTVYAEGLGAAALEVLKTKPIAVALFDFNLPDTTGVHLASEAKKLRPKTKVVLMTGEENVDLTANPGVVDLVLTKPVSPAKMIEVIRAGVDS